MKFKVTKSINEKDQQIATLQDELKKAKDETATHIQTITDTQNQSSTNISQLQQQVQSLKEQNNDLIQRIINATQAINDAIQNLDSLSNDAANQKNIQDVEKAFAEIEASIQDISAAIQGQNQTQTQQGQNQTQTQQQESLPLDTPVTISGQTIDFGDAIDGLKRKASQISDPNNKYAKALAAVYAATNVDEINNALKSVDFKNGKITGGRSKKVKKQKGGFKYNTLTKRKRLTTTSGFSASDSRGRGRGRGVNKKTARKRSA